MVVSKKVSQALQRGAFVKQGAKEDCDWKQVILNAELSECQCSTTLSVTCKFWSLELSLDFLTGGGVGFYAIVLKQISCCSHRYILTLLTPSTGGLSVIPYIGSERKNSMRKSQAVSCWGQWKLRPSTAYGAFHPHTCVQTRVPGQWVGKPRSSPGCRQRRKESAMFF